MDMMINKELLKILRAEKSWSQEELAAASGLSHRTIQRIESTGKCSLDSKRSLAAVFDIKVIDFDAAESIKPVRKKMLKFYSLAQKSSVFLMVPIFIAAAIYGIRNQQSLLEYEFVVANPGDISRDVYQINLSPEKTSVIKLSEGYFLEVDKISGITPRIKSQLFHVDEQGKHLLHSSNRIGTDFKPFKYVVCAEKRVLFISPNDGLNSECKNI